MGPCQCSRGSPFTEFHVSKGLCFCGSKYSGFDVLVVRCSREPNLLWELQWQFWEQSTLGRVHHPLTGNHGEHPTLGAKNPRNIGEIPLVSCLLATSTGCEKTVHLFFNLCVKLFPHWKAHTKGSSNSGILALVDPGPFAWGGPGYPLTLGGLTECPQMGLGVKQLYISVVILLLI